MACCAHGCAVHMGVLLAGTVHFTCCVVWMSNWRFVCLSVLHSTNVHVTRGTMAACSSAFRQHAAQDWQTSCRRVAALQPQNRRFQKQSFAANCYWTLYQIHNSTFCLRNVFMYFSRETMVFFPPCNITLLMVFMTEAKCVHCTVGTEYSNIIRVNFISF